MKSVHEPVRECVSCGCKLPKAELLRIVRNEYGIFYDAKGKANGRGVYLCHQPACLEKLVKQKRLNKAFKGPVAEEVYRNIVQEIQSETDKPGVLTKQETTER